MMQFDQFQKLGQDNMALVVKSLETLQKGTQTMAAEAADYAKKAFENGTATLEKLTNAKTLDKAVEIQTDYLKASYEGLVAQATKMGELYASVAKEAYKPFEGLTPKAAK